MNNFKITMLQNPRNQKMLCIKILHYQHLTNKSGKQVFTRKNLELLFA